MCCYCSLHTGIRCASAVLSSLTGMMHRLAASHLEKTRSSVEKKKASQLWLRFWSAHQRFFSMMCISAKVPEVVRQAREAVQRGQCVVIGLQTTGEAATEASKERLGDAYTSFVSGPKVRGCRCHAWGCCCMHTCIHVFFLWVVDHAFYTNHRSCCTDWSRRRFPCLKSTSRPRSCLSLRWVDACTPL